MKLRRWVTVIRMLKGVDENVQRIDRRIMRLRAELKVLRAERRVAVLRAEQRGTTARAGAGSAATANLETGREKKR